MEAQPDPPASGATPVVVHAVTEGDAVVRVVVAGEGAEAVVAGLAHGVRPEWWPAFGLEPETDGDDPSLTLHVVLGDPSSRDRAESDLGLFAVEHLADWVAVHAALVRIDEVVLLVPGPSHAGKSTLCGAVLEAGGEVLSDEYALVSPDGARIAGWPRRVRLREVDGGLRRAGVASGGTVDGVDLVAVVAFDPTCTGPLEVRPLPAAEVVTSVLANTVCAASRSHFAFEAAVALGRRTRGVAGIRGDAAQAVPALVDCARLA